MFEDLTNEFVKKIEQIAKEKRKGFNDSLMSFLGGL